ncbi:MAG: ImmA/IrrE family metallo-endopeptidase [Armatimonadota bacterium]|nr:ImmA/IrrE family metallo-endopeptidase [Armatimonadota bacterium]
MTGVYFSDEAEMFAHKAWKALDLTPPADVDMVARKLGIALHRQEFVPEIDGLYLRIPDCPPVIAINSSYVKPPGRQRFTAAHEIGHHLLSRGRLVSDRVFFLDGADTKKNAMETACDRFAALLLMPEDLIRRHFKELEANKENRVAILADRFGVSAWAVRRRLKELGLPYATYRFGRQYR